jgi:hypothetical protein
VRPSKTVPAPVTMATRPSNLIVMDNIPAVENRSSLLPLWEKVARSAAIYQRTGSF